MNNIWSNAQLSRILVGLTTPSYSLDDGSDCDNVCDNVHDNTLCPLIGDESGGVDWSDRRG